MKLTVTGLTGGLLSLGTAGEFSKGNIPPVLELREADTCLLSQKMTPLGPVLVLTVHWARPVGGSATNTKFKPSKITGDIKPLDLANQRAASTKSKKTDNSDAEPDAEEGFLVFLNNELRGSVVPDYALGVTLKTVGQMLVRYNDLKQAISICDNGWVRKEKGRGSAYCVPATFAEHTNTGYHRYASRRFNKAEIEDALGISKGVASGDRGLFEHRDLPFVDDAQKWVDGNLVRDEDRAIRSAFDKMAPKEWKHYLETSKKRGDKEREKEARRNKDEKRKRRAESEAEANKDAKTRKRQRRHKSVDTAAGSEEDEEIILQAKLREIKRKKQRWPVS
ncbi:hypothetical protein C8R43DRAFT_144728 [Mycena crocata]|nr:hypothetical protein C8R43DRAFT_144728 [Mycena crocata]